MRTSLGTIRSGTLIGLDGNLLQSHLPAPKLHGASRFLVLENKTVDRAEDELEFLLVAGRQVHPEDPGVVVAEEELLTTLVMDLEEAAWY
jgi:hypothetical protein